MLTVKDLLAIWLGKITICLLKLRGSGGSALPGFIVEKISPDFLKNTLEGKNIILVSGTNGKTTTCRLISSLFDDKVIHNRTGSNLIRGQISAVLSQSSWLGKLPYKNVILETDEAILPLLLKKIKPSHLVLTNLFRDQLDRYGEIDTTAKKWLIALQNTDYRMDLIVNADDPYLTSISKQIDDKHNIIYYGLNDNTIGQKEASQFADAVMNQAGEELYYTRYYISHLGHYHGRPTPTYGANQIELHDEFSNFNIENEGNSLEVKLNLSGLYNVYNALATAALAYTLHLPSSKIQDTFLQGTNVFGRGELIDLETRKLRIYLIKNPAGATEIIKTIEPLFSRQKTNLLIAANDHFADGKDVSWYWDTPFELLKDAPINELIFSGTRAYDMALRFKYALVDSEYSHGSNILKSALIDPSIQAIFPYIKSNKADWIIIATYTASLQIQKALSKYGLKDKYWKE